ncbi:sulfite oxidase [Deinococcus radiopugnans]|uniref:DMSO/TMAO reductase YedYZ molybdopterin-dependent catalytic subunit n=2 Tax=Deinococcus radiopugnans ATCC 19172 TaxID=585398 RepID=A0ABR6NMH8_9DEIO|nr:sulfite oxidase [Deinococcus radiopugnans]MBB6015246.1 DMSO/TMAO reductase YedYZ molybdopterin-dependent catalytic subunit [Deinococcus radiopugnans ATCC 19172]
MTMSSTPRPAALIVRQASPPNLEMPFHTLDERITSGAGHYVRSHFPAPELNAQDWRLRLGGLVDSPLELSLEDLKAMPPHTLTATMECAGNGRLYLSPRRPGVQWDLGAVGTAEWTGVRLSDVLERAGVTPGALEVVLEGADCGTLTDPGRTPGEIHYARSLPLSKALDDVLLAYAMNGQPLTRDHGFPVRAVVPGWYGMAAVKWLTTLHVTGTPYQGFFQTVDYSFWAFRDGLSPQMVPINAMLVKAQIARPAPHDAVKADSSCEVTGAAWTGNGNVTRVEFSGDGGQTWADAELLDAPQPGVWRRWRALWQTPAQPGPVTLLARASDSAGRTQEDGYDAGRGGYMINFPLPITVHVQTGEA